jgi:glyoxylase-like metal-dependent hydrolase (beta-lactamase superfamily II)
MKKKTLTLSLIVILSLGAFAQGNNMDTVKIRPVKITDNIYMLKDDQFAPLSNKINGAIKTLDPGEIRFLINTHVHGDHSGGNENFSKMGVTIVAHDRVRERMMNPYVDRDNKTTPPRDSQAWPALTFMDKMSLHLNDEDIDIVHLDKGHTDGDVVIHFKKANIFHTGDAFVRYGYPFVDLSRGGSFNGFVSALDKMLLLMDDNSKVIPGHGELATKADVKIFRDKLADIRDQVTAALKKGKKNEDITALGITDKYDAEWGKGFVKGKDFVLMVAENLKPVSGK